jgi:hypothetical protein
MKRVFFILSIAISSTLAQAVVVDNGFVNGLSTFKAEYDNSIWLRLDAFEATNPNGIYSAFITDLSNAGFSIATGGQVMAMLSDNGLANPSQNWGTISNIIGIAGSRDDFTGGYVFGQHWVTTYSDHDNWRDIDWTSSDANQFFGVWATTSPVPIPAAVWLFGSALVGLIGLKRNK